MSELPVHSSPQPEDDYNHDSDSSSTFPPTPLQTNAREGLSPISPRPLHITEPSSVPVLENQMDPAFIKTGEPTANAVEALNNLQTAKDGDDPEELDTGSSHSVLYDPASTASIPEPKDTTMGENEEEPAGGSANKQNPSETNNSPPTTIGDVNPSISSPSPPTNTNMGSTAPAGQLPAAPLPAAPPTVLQNTASIDLQALLSQLSPETLKVASPTTITPATTTFPLISPTLLPAPVQTQAASSPVLPSQPAQPIAAPATTTTSPNLPPIPVAAIHSLPPTPITIKPSSLPPPPPSLPNPPHVRQRSMSQGSSVEDEGEGKPFTPEEEKAYAEFLSEEKEYVSKGQWDRFPVGSRMFIGNLPTEKVKKEDLFRIFSRHGRLAQISIKQAYGFIQFLDVSSCESAIKAEEGTPVRGRRMHLEVSKPQNNTRQERRGRSRSPEPRGPLSPRSGRSSYRDRDRDHDRDRDRDRHYRDIDHGLPRGRSDKDRDRDRGRDWDRGRDSYRGRDRDDYRRSPPPRMRVRDDYRPSRDRTRSRTPPSRYRSRSPGDSLAIPRRAPHEVPEVQFIVIDKLQDDFIYYVRDPFHKKKIKNDVLYLSHRIPVEDVIRRQILEGVLAVGILDSKAEQTGKVTIQVFDRRGGESNVRFETYENLAPEVACELVDRVKIQTGAAYKGYAQPQPPMVSPFGTLMGMPAFAPQGRAEDMLATLDPQVLQKFIGSMQQMGANPAMMQQQFQQMLQMQQLQQQQQQPQQQPQRHQQHNPPHSRQNSQQMYPPSQPEPQQNQQQMQADLVSILAARGALPQAQPQQSGTPQGYGGYPPNLANLLASGNPAAGGQPGQVNSLLETLAQFKR